MGGTAMAQEADVPHGQVAPLNPDFLQWHEDYLRGTYHPWSASGHPLGAAPSPLDLSHLKGQGGVSEPRSYPSSYDLRTYGKMTGVRDQDGCGVCWAFASLGSMESTLETAETRDFSENNMKNKNGFDGDCCSTGGAYYKPMAYLARWDGPLNETDDPYGESCTSSGGNVQKHLQNAIIIPDRTTYTANDAIKQALMSYGGVDCAFYYDDSNYHSGYHSYYYNGNTAVNHAVVIAGWDDNFSASHFNTAPPGNGAFLIKNSWNTSWGDNGYFWISYYDAMLSEFAVFLAESTSNFNVHGQYDPLGWVNTYGYGSQTGWFANLWKAGGSFKLTAVSFYVSSYNSPYAIYIYTGVTSGPRSGTLALSQTGTVATAGYHTILLSSPVSLATNQMFSAVVQLTTPGYNYPIPIHYAMDGYSSTAVGYAGTNFMSANGSTWYDATTEMNSTTSVCLKVFGTTGSTSVCQPDATTLCLNNNRFKVQATWWDYSGNTGPGTVVPYGSSDSGMFWFFASTNWEMLIKVLNGCGSNNHYWVYAAATTDVKYQLHVTDTSTGATKEYDNPPHNASPAITDSGAFATCP